MRAHLPFAVIEPLEARIAPAAITVFAGQLGSISGETDYVDVRPQDQRFINTEANPGDAISAAVGPGNPGPDTFYVTLDAGSKLKVFSSTSGFQTFINVKAGSAVAFFVDKDGNNEVSRDELTGLALGPGTVIRVAGNVDGDIIGNYNPAANSLGKSGPSDLMRNAINGIFVSGNVNGTIASGGTLQNVKISGNVDQILAGTAANGFTYDFNTRPDPAALPLPVVGIPGGGQTLAVSAPGVGVGGTSILHTQVGSTDLIKTGDGGLGAKGGRISDLQITGDVNGFDLVTGAGGAGTGGLLNGGAGGKIGKVLVGVPPTGDPSPNDLIHLSTGDGGNAASGGAGGNGGTVKGVLVGFENKNGTVVKSVNTLQDNIFVETGDGGNGRLGGRGGAILSDKFIVSAPNTPDNPATLLVDESLTVDEIRLIAGNGGDGTQGGVGTRSGSGGLIDGVDVRNLDTTSGAASIILRGGDGGTAAGNSSGGNGGSIKSTRALGFVVDARAGEGSDGTVVGGRGGSLRSFILEEHPNGAHTRSANLLAGDGGSGAFGGRGGSVRELVVNNADFEVANIIAGDGGNSTAGAGGRGGSLLGLDIVDISSDLFGASGNLVMTAGAGGTSQSLTGGAGGSIVDAFVDGQRLNLSTVAGGVGGASSNGRGGKGGSIVASSFITFQQVAEIDVVANIAAGNGGVGGNRGGAGGAALTLNVVADGNVTVAGGDGANGGSGAVGRGGSVLSLHGRSNFASLTVDGGDAGLVGRAGAGGGVTQVRAFSGTRTEFVEVIDPITQEVTIEVVVAPGNVTIRAGDGHGGGAGGSIRKIGYAETNIAGDLLNPPAPSGSVLLQAGDGSSGGAAAGIGGSVKNVSGYVGLTGTTQILAGDGGGAGIGGSVGAAGGNVKNINLFGGGAFGVEFAIEAGDAGDAGNASLGARGGFVQGVAVANLDPAAIFRHIGAGNGGDAGDVGGRGGSVKNISVDHDIGMRSGEGFGYSTMGGIFAGSGGTAGGTLAKSGNVIDVVAHSISTIAAGRPEAGSVITQANLANKVSRITLKGFDLGDPLAPSSFEATEVDATGAFTNFFDANLVGGVVNPTQAGVLYPTPHPHANTFDPGEYGDTGAANPGTFGIGDTVTALTDGFIAAVRYINTFNNFKPEALLTVDANGTSTFFDLNNLNGQQIA